jgi:hypothetical protein
MVNKIAKGRSKELLCQKEYIAYMSKLLNKPKLLKKWRATRNIIKTKKGYFAFQNDFFNNWDLAFLYKEVFSDTNNEANIIHLIQVKKGYTEAIYNELKVEKPYKTKAYLAVYDSKPRDKQIAIELPHFWLIEVME